MQQVWTALGPEWSKIVIWIGVGLAILVGLTVVIWLLMKIFGRSLNVGGSSGRGQPQRLGITGAFNVDRKGRKLVIVRRDNVEHLLLIGGPNDVLVENNIIRAERASRQVAQGETPEPVIAPPAPVAPAPAVVAPPPPVKPVTAPAASVAPLPPVRRDPPMVPTPPAPPMPPAPPAPIAPPPPPPPVAAPVATPKPQEPVKAPEPLPVIVGAPSAEVAQPVVEPTPQAPRPAASDPRLSDMARRLQSVLQRPLTPVQRAAPAQPAAVDAAETKPIPLPSSRKADDAPKAEAPKPAEAPVAVKPPKAAPAAEKPADPPVTQGKDLPATPLATDSAMIDSLEEEMARLLGRPGPGKA